MRSLSECLLEWQTYDEPRGNDIPAHWKKAEKIKRYENQLKLFNVDTTKSSPYVVVDTDWIKDSAPHFKTFEDAEDYANYYNWWYNKITWGSKRPEFELTRMVAINVEDRKENSEYANEILDDNKKVFQRMFPDMNF